MSQKTRKIWRVRTVDMMITVQNQAMILFLFVLAIGFCIFIIHCFTTDWLDVPSIVLAAVSIFAISVQALLTAYWWKMNPRIASQSNSRRIDLSTTTEAPESTTTNEVLRSPDEVQELIVKHKGALEITNGVDWRDLSVKENEVLEISNGAEERDLTIKHKEISQTLMVLREEIWRLNKRDLWNLQCIWRKSW